jgi:pSer/pThr/pTyr-binding forkhead associated (FHA) protein
MSTSPLPAFDGEESQSRPASLTLRLSLKGQPVQTFHFDQRVVTVGRDPNCDVFVDNPGVSRQHFHLECADSGEYRVVDGGSSNGTYLNERPVRNATLRSGDSIQFAKYSLEVAVEELIGDGGRGPRARDRSSDAATVMLSPAEVRQIVNESKTAAQQPRTVALRRPPESALAPPPLANSWLPWAVVGLAAAIAISAAVVWIVTH